MPRQSGPKSTFRRKLLILNRMTALSRFCGTISKPFKSFQNRCARPIRAALECGPEATSSEQLSLRQWTTGTFIMPTAAMKLGDFTGLRGINDPLAGGAAFPGNQVPAQRISPIAQFFMKYMRDPNMAGTGPAGTGVNFIGRDQTSQDSPRFNIRGDYHPTSNDMLSGGVKIFNDGPHLYSGGGPE